MGSSFGQLQNRLLYHPLQVSIPSHLGSSFGLPYGIFPWLFTKSQYPLIWAVASDARKSLAYDKEPASQYPLIWAVASDRILRIRGKEIKGSQYPLIWAVASDVNYMENLFGIAPSQYPLIWAVASDYEAEQGGHQMYRSQYPLIWAVASDPCLLSLDQVLSCLNTLSFGQ